MSFEAPKVWVGTPWFGKGTTSPGNLLFSFLYIMADLYYDVLAELMTN